MTQNVKCNDCGLVFDAEDVAIAEESRGEYFGYPAYESVAVCPRCGCPDLEECEECEDGE